MKQPQLWLAVVFLIVIASQAIATVDVIRELNGNYPQTPIVLGDPWPTVRQVVYGDVVHVGDRVIAIDGQPPMGTKDLEQSVRASKPGNTVTISVESRGQRADRTIILRPVNGWWAFDIVWGLFMPWFSIALGFWVVAARPSDIRAWSLLGILVGLSQISRQDPVGWPTFLGMAAVFSLKIAQHAWPACLLLFGIYFPQHWRFDRRLPWIKWILIVPLAILAVWDGIRSILFALNFTEAERLPAARQWLSLTLMACCNAGFFWALATKMHDPQAPLAPDDLRRGRLLIWGCQAALTPFALVFFYSFIVRHRLPQDSPALVLALMAMVLLPVTLAYVIVVERALDVRVVIRQGMQYALARSGIRVIQLCLGVGVVYLSVRLFDSQQVSRLAGFAFIAVGIALVTQIRELGDRVRGWLDRRFFREAYDAERILGDLSEQVRTILDGGELLETVMRKISESLHVERIAVLLPQNGLFKPALATGYAAQPELVLSDAGPAVSELRRTHQPLLVGEPSSEEDRTVFCELHAQVLLPLESKQDLLGLISLGPKRSEEPYSSNDLRLLLMVASQTGLALENSRLSEAIAHEVSQRELMNREIEIAREVQQRLFPQSLPKVPNLDYAGHCRPALGVGGDYYDFLALPGGLLGLAIADISGKGIPAALLMASLQASVRGQSQSPGEVASLMTNVNRLVYEASSTSRYATFFYAQFDPATRGLTWANGGHNPPLLLRGSEVIRLETGGPVVGLLPRSAYAQDSIVLEPGDLLVLYTDGMTEAENLREEEWGEDALMASARSCSTLPPAEMISMIMKQADAFAGEAPQHDDMTLVIAKVLN